MPIVAKPLLVTVSQYCEGDKMDICQNLDIGYAIYPENENIVIKIRFFNNHTGAVGLKYVVRVLATI